MSAEQADLNQITKRIIGCAYTVANTLGNGFLEKVYEKTLAHELRKSGLSAEAQSPIRVVNHGDKEFRRQAMDCGLLA